MYIVWHFENEKPQIQGIFDDEKQAQNACCEGDCYHFIEVNKIYKESTDTTDISLYKCPDGRFRSGKELFSRTQNI